MTKQYIHLTSLSFTDTHMRFINQASLSLTMIAAMAVLPACGKDRGIGHLVSGTNGGGVEGTFTPSRVDGSWVIGSVHLANKSNGTVNFTNFQVGNSYPGFTLAVESQPPVAAIAGTHFNPWVGMVSSNNGAQMTEMPKGSEVTLEFKWKLLSVPSTKKNYAFTVTVTNMTQNGAAIPDVTIQRPAAP